MNKNLIALAAAVALTACGGGGGDSDDDASAGAAEGFWTGTTSNGYDYNLLVLEDGEFWAVYGRNGIAYGATQGNGSGNNTEFEGEGTDYFFAGGSVTDGTVNARVVPKTSISGEVDAEGASPVTFSGTYEDSYDSPAMLSDLQGAWPISTISPSGVESGNITFAANGSLTGTVSTCSFTGQATPRSTGKNVFNATVRFASSGCLYNGQTLNGIMVVTENGALQTLTAAALRGNGEDGFLASGSR